MTFTLKCWIMDECTVDDFDNIVQAIDTAENRAGVHDERMDNVGKLDWFIRNGELSASSPGPILYTIERKDK